MSFIINRNFSDPAITKLCKTLRTSLNADDKQYADDKQLSRNIRTVYVNIRKKEFKSTLHTDLVDGCTSRLDRDIIANAISAMESVIKFITKIEICTVYPDGCTQPFDLDTFNQIGLDQDVDELDNIINDFEDKVSNYQEIINEYSEEDSIAVTDFAMFRMETGYMLSNMQEKAFYTIAYLYAIRSTLKVDDEWTESSVEKMAEFVEDVKDVNKRLIKAIDSNKERKIKSCNSELDDIIEDAKDEWIIPTAKKIKGQMYYLKQCIEMLDANYFSKTIAVELKTKEIIDLGSSNVSKSHKLRLELIKLRNH